MSRLLCTCLGLLLSMAAGRCWADKFGLRVLARRLPAVAILVLLALSTPVLAVQVGIDAFTSAAVIQDYESLGTASIFYTTPLVIGGDVYDTDDRAIRSSGKFGHTIGRSGVGIGHVCNDSGGFIEIALGSPALRAGLYVGNQYAWTADVEFYSPSGTILGSVPLTGAGSDSSFVAWQSENAGIGRLRIVDTTGAHNQMMVDDLIKEVPEPGSLVYVLAAGTTLLGFRRRQRNQSPGS
jgi:hypothetical protein